MFVSLLDDNVMQYYYDNDNGDISNCIILIGRDIDRISNHQIIGSAWKSNLKYLFVNLSVLLYLINNVMFSIGTGGHLGNHFHFTEK